jgi:TolB protein
MEIVDTARASYQLTGSNSDKVEGHLTDASKANLLSAAFSKGTSRAQAHALADAVAKIVTGKPGIASTKIAFRVDNPKGAEIFIADYDGHNAIQVTRDDDLVRSPIWVPGQRKLYYTTYKSGFPDIVSQDLGTGARKVIASYGGSNFSPAPSANGLLAMILSKSGSPDLYISDLNGESLKQLTKTKDDESSPCWSPDGQTICYVSRHGGRPVLFTLPRTGGEPKRIRTEGVAGHLTEPDWSPDGQWIAFTAQMGAFNICVVPAQGGEVKILTEGEDPSWAPNSRTLVFTRQKKNKRTLSLLDAPTKHVKDVMEISGSSSQPSWAK